MNITELLGTSWLGVPLTIWFGILTVAIVIVIRHPALRFRYKTKRQEILLEAGKKKTG